MIVTVFVTSILGRQKWREKTRTRMEVFVLRVCRATAVNNKV